MQKEENLPEFGIKRENEERRDGGCGIVFDPETGKFAVGRELSGKIRLFSGGVEEGEDIQQGILREVTEESGLHDFEKVEYVTAAFCHFYNSLKDVNRVCKATCFLVILKSTNLVETQLEEHENFWLDWVSAEEMISNWESINENNDYDHWFYFLEKALEQLRELGYIK